MRIRLGKFWPGLGIAVLPFILIAGDSVQGPSASIPMNSVPSFAGNAQHTAVYQPTVPSLNRIRWSATVDFNNTGSPTHYGAPLVTAGNTVLAPVKIAGDAFRIDAFDGVTGATKYSLATDYILPMLLAERALDCHAPGIPSRTSEIETQDLFVGDKIAERDRGAGHC